MGGCISRAGLGLTKTFLEFLRAQMGVQVLMIESWATGRMRAGPQAIEQAPDFITRGISIRPTASPPCHSKA